MTAVPGTWYTCSSSFSTNRIRYTVPYFDGSILKSRTCITAAQLSKAVHIPHQGGRTATSHAAGAHVGGYMNMMFQLKPRMSSCPSNILKNEDEGRRGDKDDGDCSRLLWLSSNFVTKSFNKNCRLFIVRHDRS